MLKHCLVLDQEHFGACIHLATLLANTGENVKAAKYFKHAIKLDPNSVPANFGLAKTFNFITNMAEQSIPIYERIIKLDNKHYKAHCQLGIQYFERNNLEKAAEHLKASLSINPKHVPGLVGMGNLLFESGYPR